MSNAIKENIFKAPVITFIGHVDAGKTSLQECISKNIFNNSTNEHGGITQNIGTRYISKEKLINLASKIKGKFVFDTRLPGILSIDTPGHEAFNNMRCQGSNQCDLAVLVIDILKGVMPQTIESINILKENKIPFVIALTKIDRIDGWIDSKKKSLRLALKKNSSINNILLSYIEDIKYDLEKENITAQFYFNNKKPKSVYSIIPLSSKTQEGIPDLICMISYLTFNWMAKKVTFTEKTKISIVKSYKDKNMGWVVEAILSNGFLKKGDEFYLCNYYNPTKTKVKLIMIKQQGKWVQTNKVIASNYCKIMGTNLEEIITGTYMYNVKQLGEDEALEKATNNISNIWNQFKYKNGGVIIAPSFGELSACYYQLSKDNIPISKVIIGTLTISLVDRINIILEESEKCHQVIYNFGSMKNEKINQYIKKEQYNLTVINDFIVYNIVEKAKDFIENANNLVIEEMIENGKINYPVKCEIVPGCIFNKGGNSEIVIGLEVKQGKLIKFSNIYAINNGKLVNLGKVHSLEKDNQPIEEAVIGDKIAVKISNPDTKLFGRHFEEKDNIVSFMSREIIENLKKYYRKKLSKKEWHLVKSLKEKFNII
mgnify:CR=1 FL=1